MNASPHPKHPHITQASQYWTPVPPIGQIIYCGFRIDGTTPKRPSLVVCMDPHLENILNRVCAYSGITVPGDHPFRVRMLYWDGWRHQPLGSQLRSWVLRLAGPKQGAWHLQRNGQSPVGGLLCTWKNLEKLFHPPVSKWCCQVSPTTAGFTLQCIWSAIMESFLRIIPA